MTIPMKFSLLVAAALASGCSGVLDADADSPQHVLASLDQQGSHIWFEQLDGQQIAVLATRPAERASVLDDPAIVGMNASQKYSYWSGKPAPATLAQAQAQSDEARAETEAAAQSSGSDGPVVAQTSALTSDEFRDSCCRGGLDHARCDTDLTESISLDWRAHQLWGTVNAKSGEVDLELRLDRALGGWQSRGRWTVLEGQTLDYELQWNGLAARPLGVRIGQVDPGDLYHLLAKHLD
jgi:hypothetical protein